MTTRRLHKRIAHKRFNRWRTASARCVKIRRIQPFRALNCRGINTRWWILKSQRKRDRHQVTRKRIGQHERRLPCSHRIDQLRSKHIDAETACADRAQRSGKCVRLPRSTPWRLRQNCDATDLHAERILVRSLFLKSPQ